MRYFSIIGLLFIFACNKENKEILAKNTTSKITNEIVLKTDTLKLSFDKDLEEDDFILIKLLEKNFTNDGIEESKFKFDFYRNGKLENNFSVNVNFLVDESDWHGNTLFNFSEKHEYSPYIIITNGYPACGYTQTNFLIDVRKENIQLIDTFYSVGDGGWFTSTTFEEISNSKLGARHENYWQEEDDTDEMGTLTFSDSVNYILENKNWIKKYITPKDSIYKKQKISFDVMHKIQ